MNPWFSFSSVAKKTDRQTDRVRKNYVRAVEPRVRNEKYKEYEKNTVLYIEEGQS